MTENVEVAASRSLDREREVLFVSTTTMRAPQRAISRRFVDSLAERRR